MRKVYICSPYRADNSAELDRNIEYAQFLTKQALLAGLAPITPHLYLTQCLNEEKAEERAAGMAVGIELLKGCEYVIAGVRHGISEGMQREIAMADKLGIEVVNADKLKFKIRHDETRAVEYAKQCTCNFCKGYSMHSCTGYDCREPYQKAYEYAIANIEEL